MSRRLLALALLGTTALSLLASLGCTEKVRMPTAPAGPTGPLVTPDSIQAIFSARCIQCHSGSTPAAGMDLSADNSYANTVNVGSSACAPLDRIEPNDPANSCLVRRIEGTVLPRMPLGGTGPLPAADIARIRGWVSQGAPGVVSGPAL
jgi:hypothetical protein